MRTLQLGLHDHLEACLEGFGFQLERSQKHVIVIEFESKQLERIY